MRRATVAVARLHGDRVFERDLLPARIEQVIETSQQVFHPAKMGRKFGLLVAAIGRPSSASTTRNQLNLMVAKSWCFPRWRVTFLLRLQSQAAKPILLMHSELSPPALQTNPELELARRYVNQTMHHVFLTGRAGTGKTTFVDELRRTTPKRFAVVAPTGVAAINAGGTTIHSFFQLPFGTLNTPEKRTELDRKSLRRERQRLIRSLDLLIIDEISMVRADTLDAIDRRLRQVRRNSLPFGGVQLLMVGDLHQLPPVVRRDEKTILAEDYESVFFFGSQALQQAEVVTIELKKIYRQSDPQFIGLLNQIRQNQLDGEAMKLLKARLQKNSSQSSEEAVILTSHRRTSEDINQSKLAELTTRPKTYTATVEGTFSESAYPTVEKLVLKVGARVMFIKNDPSELKQFYNGKMGRVTALFDEGATVECDDGAIIDVGYASWENTTYQIDPMTNELAQKVLGVFTQIPLRLAWAITIHKSQGLTFDRVAIDANAAFAHGQVYVALSRCRSLEGIELLSEIGRKSLRSDEKIVSFEENYHENPPTEATLSQAKKQFELFALQRLYDFSEAVRLFGDMINFARNVRETDEAWAVRTFSCADVLSEKIAPPAAKFSRIIEFTLQELDSVKDDEAFIDRLKNSGRYFQHILEDKIWPKLIQVAPDLDNQKSQLFIDQKLADLRLNLFTKKAIFAHLSIDFDLEAIQRITATAPLTYEREEAERVKKAKKKVELGDIKHGELYETLRQWRVDQASEIGKPAFVIMSNKVLKALCEALPRSERSLQKVSGIGKQKARQYGLEILDIIDDFCRSNNLSGDNFTEVEKQTEAQKRSRRAAPSPTALKSFELYRKGNSLEDIAEERGLAHSTIEGHLAQAIEHDLISVSEFMDKSDVKTISRYFDNSEETGLGAAFNHFGGDYSYGQLRMVLAEVLRNRD